MKKHSSVEDFLEDRSFRDWVLGKSEAERHYWEAYGAKHVDQVHLLEQARAILLELNKSDHVWSPERQDATLAKIRKKIGVRNGKSKVETFPVHQPQDRRWTSPVLLVFLATMFAGYVFWDRMAKSETDTSAEDRSEERWVTKSNPKGQKSRIRLPDGSIVTLNAASEIRFREGFGRDDRGVYLSGEAFFEVESDTLIPFQVHSGGLTTTAVGTAFNVTSYEKDYSRVQLAEGEVIVREEFGEESLSLKPGEQVALDGDKGMKLGKFDLDKAFLWKEGRLLFQRATVAEFLITLERWYGVDIETEGTPRSGIRINGDYKEPYLNAVLESIGFAYGFEYEINHKKVKIKFNPK